MPLSLLLALTLGASPRQRTLLDADWRFRLDPAASIVASAPDFDDHGWRVLHLPHDYVVEGPFDQRADNSHGSHPVFPAWYRKTFELPAGDRDKSVWVDFDGVFRNSDAYLNGHLLGHWSSGYIGFRYDLKPYANFGGRNVLAVRVDPRRPEGWWYEGGGIYRHVWLNVADPVHVAPEGGVFVRSQVEPDRTATLDIQTTIVNDGSRPEICQVNSLIVAPDGRQPAAATSQIVVPPHRSSTLEQPTRLFRPVLWSLGSPKLYRVETTIERDGKPVDQTSATFGIRTIAFDKDLGFTLNGVPVKLQGTCNHQDHAGVGIAMPDRLLEWRIKKLKEMGANAYRCSHNPPAAELLDACDRQGMLVMDETRHLGDATTPKSPRGTTATDLTELKAMVLRDRNHPSVIMWSLANEEGLQSSKEGATIYRAMEGAVKALDPTRPVTSAMDGGWGQGYSLVEDLLGINYHASVYDQMHRRMPNIPIYGSETASALSTRGEYANDRAKGAMSAYDLNAPPWGATAEAAWTPIAEQAFVAGGFVWTGFDYRGEPTPYRWPNVSSQFGIMDTCGFPKDTYYYYRAWWTHEPTVHILPSWNWTGKEGRPISVWVYANTQDVELRLNGKSLGMKQMPTYGHLEWTVPYAPGVLEARGTFRGTSTPPVIDRVETTGRPVAIRLSTDRTTLADDGEDLTQVEVDVVDAQGRIVPDADNLITFDVNGAGTVAGVGNGNPASHEPDKATRRQAFHGRCAVLIQDRAAGPIHLTAHSPTLREAKLSLSAR